MAGEARHGTAAHVPERPERKGLEGLIPGMAGVVRNCQYRMARQVWTGHGKV